MSVKQILMIPQCFLTLTCHQNYVLHLLIASAKQLWSNNGSLNNVMEVVTKLLDPESNEFTDTSIVQFILTIVTKAGNFLGSNIQWLLKALITKLQSVESLNVVMNYLIIAKMRTVMTFLNTDSQIHHFQWKCANCSQYEFLFS